MSHIDRLIAEGTVVLENVTKRYRLGDGSWLTAIDCPSFIAESGTSTALVGPSGSGKSTLLHLVGAIDKPDEGTITVGGLDLTTLNRKHLADYRSTIGLVFQQYHLLPAMSALDNVLAPLVGRKVRFDRKQRAGELLASVGLADRAHAVPSQMSGGQQQRVAIARALINNPTLLLADEPTGNLDASTAAGIVELLRRLQSERGMTMMIGTHDEATAKKCDIVVTIERGELGPNQTTRLAVGRRGHPTRGPSSSEPH